MFSFYFFRDLAPIFTLNLAAFVDGSANMLPGAGYPHYATGYEIGLYH